MPETGLDVAGLDVAAVDVAALTDRLHRVQAAIAAAVRDAGRDPASITTIVVTKFQPIELVRALVDLGVVDFGESRHQEAQPKAAAIPDARWHFIGQLQTNKARAVAQYAAAIHSVDRPGLADALGRAIERERPPLDVFLEIDLAGTPGRGGADPADVEHLAEHISATAGLRLRGVMAVAPQDDEPARAFARLHSLSESVQRIDPAATEISAGMSGDFAIALAAGATHLRIGSAITGPRPPGP